MISLHNTFILPHGAVLPSGRMVRTSVNAIWIIRNCILFNVRRDCINLCGQAGAFLGEEMRRKHLTRQAMKGNHEVRIRRNGASKDDLSTKDNENIKQERK